MNPEFVFSHFVQCFSKTISFIIKTHFQLRTSNSPTLTTAILHHFTVKKKIFLNPDRNYTNHSLFTYLAHVITLYSTYKKAILKLKRQLKKKRKKSQEKHLNKQKPKKRNLVFFSAFLTTGLFLHKQALVWEQLLTFLNMGAGTRWRMSTSGHPNVKAVVMRTKMKTRARAYTHTRTHTHPHPWSQQNIWTGGQVRRIKNKIK